jgi:anhydro-N-acetylmuramic acid kinase
MDALPPPPLYIGLMSGTSLDGVDGVLADLSGSPQVLAHASCDFPDQLRQELLDLNRPGENELHRAALAANRLALRYAEVVNALKAQAGPQAIRAIGAHGQTVRHRPQEFGGPGYTLQLNNPALLAELTGLDVVADFRNADLAAGGQGAPLVPAFHAALWARPGQWTAVLNIGGISNLSLLGPAGEVLGFDCGPGNALLDHWCQRHTGQPYDAGGAWAATGQVNPALLQALLADPFFAKAPPKSTGRDLFNAQWLNARLANSHLAPADVQATLTALTVWACAHDLQLWPQARQLLVCGGGALNRTLMTGLQAVLPEVQVQTTEQKGLPVMQVEATAFAWLAQCHVERRPASLPAVTGARAPRVLGALYPCTRA